MVNGERTFFTNEETSGDKKYDETRICQMIDFLIDNIYIKIGFKAFNLKSRYIDDLISINNPRFKQFLKDIYQRSLWSQRHQSLEMLCHTWIY